jgi:DNA polymerase elongation subunit (family B)
MYTDNAICFDIETGKSPDYLKFIPDFKEPKLTKKGEPYANQKTVEEQRQDWEEKCALKASTGRVILITIKDSAGSFIIRPGVAFDGLKVVSDDDGVVVSDESSMLRYFWEKIYHGRLSEQYLIGHNSHDFDLPFLYQRSCILGVPTGVNPLDRNWKMSIDLEEVWNRFKPQKMTSLDEISKALGNGEKFQHGEVSEHFEMVWENNPTLAIEACLHDIELLYANMRKLLS